MDKLVVEIIRNAAIFASEEMGVVLKNTAYSPNIKDRLDYSCAVLSPRGELVAQAEHIPVHLGSMSVGVQNTIRELEKHGEKLEPGDVILVNDPYIAGTHLNDLTVVKPVYYRDVLIAYVANKAHHVDIGGSVPGSLGGRVVELVQEGLIIPPVKIVVKGSLNKDVLSILESNIRTPEYFRGDLKAQLAALNTGEKRVLELVSRYGVKTLLESWDEILSYTERYTRSIIRKLGVRGTYTAEDYLEYDDRLVGIRVSLSLGEDNVVVDFTGSHKQVDAPINAVYGVTVASTSFALKSVLDPEMPMNHGFFRVVDIKAPQGTIVNPVKPAPVSAGNVETSQRIADVVLKALASALPGRVPAASCGSMNNVAVGGVRSNGKTWAFYETIGCGSGGRPCCDGVDAVHTNMTNTLNTPIEILEREYPVFFIEYSIRPDSGGPGKYRGGNGIIRAFMVLENGVRVVVTGERVKTRPWGLEGGKNGAPAEYLVVRSNGRVERLRSKDETVLNKGDILYIKTAGGGGYGDPCSRDRKMIEEDLSDSKISIDVAVKDYCYSP